MNQENKILKKIHSFLNDSEDIEYAILQKEGERVLLVLTNHRIIYSDENLLKDNIFHFVELKDNKVGNLLEIKKRLLQDEDVMNIIKHAFF